jgi:fructose-1-phosphate kinase PfkB-like protein
VAAVTVADDPRAAPVDEALEFGCVAAELVADVLEKLAGDALKDAAEALRPVVADFDGDEPVGAGLAALAALLADSVCSASDNDLVRVSIAFSTFFWADATAVCAACAASRAFWQPAMSGG